MAVGDIIVAQSEEVFDAGLLQDRV